jgi:hypothetical protein
MARFGPKEAPLVHVLFTLINICGIDCQKSIYTPLVATV